MNNVNSNNKNVVNSDEDYFGFVACHALSVKQGVRSSEWIIDSGATCHMCNNKNMFCEMNPLSEFQTVSVGDGHSLDVAGLGTVSLNMILPNSENKLCKLYNALYVPELSYNLISVSKASKAGKTVKFIDNVCEIMQPNGEIILNAEKRDNLYFVNYDSDHYIKCNLVDDKEISNCDTWHKRFGHLCESSLKSMAAENLVDGFNYDVNSKLKFCVSCAEGKMSRSAFPKKVKKSRDILELVHSDVCGKINTKSLSNAEYFLTFIDDATHYTWVYFLQTKDQVFEKFMLWKTEVEKSSGKQLKVFRTDNGGEYYSSKFENYLKTEGVRHDRTVPKTPEQNGVSERMNRTLVESVRSMLSESKLPQKFWAEALSTATYLRNRSPTAALSGKTPYESWTGIKPSVKNLRVFGCIAYSHVPKDERKKLDPKARKCIMLGYGDTTKAYRLYDTEKMKVIFSRDVRFDESSRKSDENNYANPNYVDIFHSEIDPDCVEDGSGSEEGSDSEEGEEITPRQSSRVKRPPNRYGDWTVLATSSSEPASYKEMLDSSDKPKWDHAMKNELQSLKDHNVWNLVRIPCNKNVVKSKWVFKLKTDADGKIIQHKARLVAQGYSQRPGADYDQTFSPVVRFESICAVISMATQNDLLLHQMDVSSAFLNGELQEEIYMNQPEGFVIKGKENLVCKLNISFYGLKQSARCWNNCIGNYLKEIDFVQSASDPCIYTSSEGELAIVAVYVDDLIIAAKTDVKMNKIKDALSRKYKMKDLGELNHFVGVKVVQNHVNNSVWLGQPAYSKCILSKFGMSDCKPISTPAAPDSKLVKATASDELADEHEYQSAVGSLLYFSSQTRPDITYAVSTVAKYCNKPTKTHWMAVKRILRYIKGTITTESICITFYM